ncbi:MAG TPA: PAS domain-containing protein [Chitinophagaceae bacterium]|nr:PAS domain-containing protein [Chitinophagaceae bacterium]
MNKCETHSVPAESACNFLASLTQSGKLYRMLADNIDDIVTLHQLDGTVDYISPSALRVMGHTLQDTKAKGGMAFIHPADVETVMQANKTVLDGMEQASFYECRIRHADGHWVTFENRNRAVRDESGKLVGILTVSRNITARKAAEEHYRMLAENITDIVALLTIGGRFEYISPSVERLLGYSQDEAIAQNPFDTIHPDDVLPLKQHTIDRNLEGEEGSFNAYRVKHKNGHWVYFDVKSKPVVDSKGRITHILKSSRNVTERVLAEQARTASEQQYKMLADNIVDLVVLLTPDFRRLYVSPSSLALTGYTPAEMLASTPEQIIDRHDIKRFYAAVQTLHKGAGKVELSYCIKHKKGHLVFVESVIKAIRNDAGQLINLLGTTRDITAQHNTEKALRESEEHYRMLADNIVDLVILLTPGFKRVYVSPSCFALTGYTPEEFMHTTMEDIIYEDDLPAFSARLKSTIFNGDDQVLISTHIKHKTGRLVYVESTVKAIRNAGGQLVNILSTIRNITKQQEAETALRNSEELYRMLADNMFDMLILYGPYLQKLYVSPSCRQLTGYTPAELMLLPAGGLVYPGDREQFSASVLENAKAGNDRFVLEHRLLMKDGGCRYFSSVFSIVRDAGGALKNIIVTSRDIHAQKTAQFNLAKSEEQYRMLANNMLDMLVLTDAQFNRLYVSPSALHVTGYTAEELLASPALDIIHPGDIESLRCQVLHSARQGTKGFNCRFKGVHKSGRVMYMSAFIGFIRNQSGQLTNIMSTSRDITAEVNAQMALAESEEKYRSLVEASENIILIMDENGKYLFANSLACNYVRAPLRDVLDKTIYHFFDRQTSDFYVDKVRTVINTGKGTSFEYLMKVMEHNVYLRNTLHPIFNASGKVYAVMLSLVDLTEIKNYAEKLRKQNEELKKIAYLQSHIVRAPLANIEGILNLIDETAMSAENLALLQMLKKSALQLDGVVNQVVQKAIHIKHQTEA